MKSALNAADFYKTGHPMMMADNLTHVYNNTTARNSRVDGVNEVVVFGVQYFVKKYLMEYWDSFFFKLEKEKAVGRFKRMMKHAMQTEIPDKFEENLKELHELGYLPIRLKSLPEGELCPIRVPFTTMESTDERFPWLPGYLETVEQNTLWGPITSATTAFEFRMMLESYAEITGGDKEIVPWQGHDFSMRGMFGMEAAAMSGAAHLLSFTGTDTITAIELHEEYYGADIEKELVAGSVLATEHSVMQVGMAQFNNLSNDKEKFEAEVAWFKELMQRFPKGILSVVCDTYDYWRVLTNILPMLKVEIEERDGKFVCRPDSGDPKHIVAGYRTQDANVTADYMLKHYPYKLDKLIYLFPKGVECVRTVEGRYFTIQGEITKEEALGSMRILRDSFGSTRNDISYDVLNPKIGIIYGDSINYRKAENILRRLDEQNFASTNIIFGLGSYTYQYVTRDTFGIACKATSCVIDGRRIAIFKDPKTNKKKRADGLHGFKKSAKGLLYVGKDPIGMYYLEEDVSPEREAESELKTVFENGKLVSECTLSEIRKRLYEDI